MWEEGWKGSEGECGRGRQVGRAIIFIVVKQLLIPIHVPQKKSRFGIAECMSVVEVYHNNKLSLPATASEI